MTAFYYYGVDYCYELPSPVKPAVDLPSESEASDPGQHTSDQATDDYAWTLRIYTPEQVAQFIHYINVEQMNVPQASCRAGIQQSTAYKLRRRMKENPGVVPGYKPRAEAYRAELSRDQEIFLQDYVDKFGPHLFLKQVMDAIPMGAQGKVTRKMVKSYLLGKLSFTIDIVNMPPVLESEQEDIARRRKAFVELLARNDIQYGTNCLFFDDCKLARTDTKIVTKERKKMVSYNLSSFLCLNADGVVAYSHFAVPSDSMRKQCTKVGEVKFNVWDHLFQFVSEVIRMAKEEKRRNLFLLFEPSALSGNKGVIDAIAKANYTAIVLPPKSPAFNPCSFFWTKVKHQIRREPLMENDCLLDRINEVVRCIGKSDCQHWVDECKASLAEVLPSVPQ